MQGHAQARVGAVALGTDSRYTPRPRKRAIRKSEYFDAGFARWTLESHRSTHPLNGPLAQLVEQETLNLKVVGSIPTRPIPSLEDANVGTTSHPRVGG